ncbi:MAG: putative nuclease of restriction endonuclease-like RecB superfamily [Myxococcota bacterium]|jgi:predicted nuclease of restriction endonuclease-like RecB superfamily
MLTGNLVRARVRRDAIRPTFIDPASELLVETATELVALWNEAAAERWTRAQVDEALTDMVGDRPDHLVVRGLAKVLTDRSEFDSQPLLDPVALRAEVFRAGRQAGPLALSAGPLDRPTAEQVLAEVGAGHGLTAEQVADTLYADLREAQRLQKVEVPDAVWLLHRYNVALAQALLLKSAFVRIEIDAPTAPRMKQLFRYVKFFQLLCAAERVDDTLVLVVDGPTSLFRQSTRYGMQLANFLPALLLHEGTWRLTSTVQWTQRRLEKQLELDAGDGLVSHYRDTGAWRSKAQTYFAERFRALETDWELLEGARPLQLGAGTVVWPDYTLRRGRREVHLEIVGFWRRDWLDRRLAALRDWAPGNLVVAVSSRLRGCREALEGFDGAVLSFAEVLSPKKVLAAAEAIIEAQGPVSQSR